MVMICIIVIVALFDALDQSIMSFSIEFLPAVNFYIVFFIFGRRRHLHSTVYRSGDVFFRRVLLLLY